MSLMFFFENIGIVTGNLIFGIMSLFCPDIDKLIAFYIFDPKLYKTGTANLKKIMIAFGRSNYDKFIEACRFRFFDSLFRYKHVKIGDIYSLLQVLINKKNIDKFPCYNKFNKHILSHRSFHSNAMNPNEKNEIESIDFKDLKSKHRAIVYVMSLYHGYLWVCTKNKIFENFGKNYQESYLDGRGEITYELMKKKRLHNLKYYVLGKKGLTLNDSTFSMKSDAELWGKGITKEIKTIRCINIISSYVLYLPEEIT